MKRFLTTIAIASSIAAYFLHFTWQGLFVGFHPDDLMNMHRAFTELRGVSGLLAILNPFTTANRPVGALYYLIVYRFAGLTPLAFRCVTYALFFTNMALVYLVVKRLCARREIAVFATLIWCYHHRFVDIYSNNGTIYDVLCFALYLTALVYWIRIRQSGREPDTREGLIFGTIFVVALNAKEMGATLPVVVAAYEIIYHRPLKEQPRRWMILATVFVIAILAAATKGRPGTAFYGVMEYQQHFTVRQFFINQRHWLDELIQADKPVFKTSYAVLLWLSLLAIALLSRSKHLLFAWQFLLVTSLPVSFIPTRGFFVMYLPYLGWAIWAATAVVCAREWLWKHLWNRPPIPAGAFEPERLLTTFAVVTLLLKAPPLDPFPYPIRDDSESQQNIRATIADLTETKPCAGKGKRVLFLNERFREEYAVVFISRLVCADPDLEVDQAWRIERRGAKVDLAQYDAIFRYQDGRLVRSRLRAAN